MRMCFKILGTFLLIASSFPVVVRAQQDKVIAGAILPMTGPLAPIGSQISDGMNFAVASINQRGGVNGRPLDVIVRDDQGAPGAASAAAQVLIDREKALALLGLPLAYSALPVREIARRSKALMISLSTAANLTGQDFGLLLRPIGREDALAKFVADYIKVNFNGKRVGGWLSSRTSQFAGEFQAAVQSRHLSLTRFDEQASSDAAPNWKPDTDVVVVGQDFQSNAALRFRAANPGVPLIIVTSVPSEPNFAVAKENETVKIISNPGPDFFEESREMVSQARSAGQQPTAYFMYGYASVQIFAALASSTASRYPSGEELRNAARGRDIPTAMGSLRFDESGDLLGWRFSVLEKRGSGVAAVDVCKAPDCKDYEQCPRNCPTK
jgi:branched-chain amino acid transport system substrate-binding protein